MITKVTGRRGLGPGALVDQLTFHTEKGHVFGPYGGSGGYSFTAKPPNSDCYLAWISGKVKNFVTTFLFCLYLGYFIHVLRYVQTYMSTAKRQNIALQISFQVKPI